jgi:hypothetical protein
MSDETPNELICWSLRCSDKTEETIEQVENSNKVILPESMLFKFQDKDFPLHFTIKNVDTSMSSVCGVFEFTSNPGKALIPYHLMQTLFIKEGTTCEFTIAYPVRGSYIKLKPHETKFIELADPKAILEHHLSKNYTVLTKGETISIKYMEEYYYIDVVECEPADTIHITDSDINLDFDEPRDYVEPPPPKEPIPPPIENVVIPRSALPALHRDKPIKIISGKFVPFSGTGNRLGK